MRTARNNFHKLELRWGPLAALFVFVFIPAAHGQSEDRLSSSAQRAYDQGDIARAITLYQELVRLQPDSVAARTDLGVALVRAARYKEAIAQYQEALKRDAKNPVVRLNLALARYKQAEFESAAEELESFRNEHPENQQSLYLLADCYLRLGRNRDAVTLLEPAYRANPDDRAVDYALGTALLREGRIREGEVVIDRILKDGESAEANFLLGEAQFAADDAKAAVSSLRRALDLNPNLPGAWSLYGRALLKSNDIAGAKMSFERALQIDPSDLAKFPRSSCTACSSLRTHEPERRRPARA